MKPGTICRKASDFILAFTLVSAAALAQAAGAPPATTWVKTNDAVFSTINTGGAANPVGAAVAATPQFQGAAAASQPVSITVVLKLNNKSTLDSYIAAQHTPGNAAYRQWLSSAQVAQNFGPTAAHA
jgi:hypothetical protein